MLTKITIADYMTKHLVTLKADSNVFDAIKTLLNHKITSAPVVDERGGLLGIFSEKDSMKVVLEQAYNQSASAKVSEYMSCDTITVDADASIVDLAERFQNSNVRAFPVYANQQLVGIISRTDVLRALVSIA